MPPSFASKDQEIVRITRSTGEAPRPAHGKGLTTAAPEIAPSEAALDPHAPAFPDDPRLSLGPRA
jgi:hypothetical protein